MKYNELAPTNREKVVETSDRVHIQTHPLDIQVLTIDTVTSSCNGGS